MKVFTAIVFAVLGVLALGLNLAEAGPPPLPLGVSGPEWRPLSQRWDQRLQTGLELALKQHDILAVPDGRKAKCRWAWWTCQTPKRRALPR